MNSNNQMNDFAEMGFEAVLLQYHEHASDKDVDCYEYHSWALAAALKMLLARSYLLCIQFCQQRLERSPSHLFCPRKTPLYWKSRESVATGVRESNVPDYFKALYMAYHVQCHAKLGHIAVATTESIHLIILLYSILQRIESDEEYVQEFSVEKQKSIRSHLSNFLASVINFTSIAVRKWRLSRSVPINPDCYCGMRLDHVYEASFALYHGALNGRNTSELLHDYVRAVFSNPVATLARSKPGQSETIFPHYTGTTKIAEEIDTEMQINLWKARLNILCAAVSVFGKKYEQSIVKLGLALNSLQSIVTKLEEENLTEEVTIGAIPIGMRLKSHSGLGSFQVVGHELDYLVTTTELRRKDMSGEIIDKGYICQLFLDVQNILCKCQLQYRLCVGN